MASAEYGTKMALMLLLCTGDKDDVYVDEDALEATYHFDEPLISQCSNLQTKQHPQELEEIERFDHGRLGDVLFCDGSVQGVVVATGGVNPYPSWLLKGRMMPSSIMWCEALGSE